MIDAISTIGEEIRNEKVTPKGKPAVVKPMNIGILEQLQKGVTVPNKAPRRLPFPPLNHLKELWFFPEGKKSEYIP